VTTMDPAGRQVVIHQDDVGMCHGANVAFLELTRLGVITSGSVMVPCPWFPEIADAAAGDPTLDVGVHLTLTAEKEHYRWGPLAGAAAPGLTDPDGYLWRDVASVRRHADPTAVEAELRAQIDRALGAGIDVTHLDAHMGAALAPEFCDIYLRLGRDYALPVLMTASLDAYSARNHLEGATDADYRPFVLQAQQDGQRLFDSVLETMWDRPASEPAAPRYQALFERVGGGLSFLALHPNAPGEVEVIEPPSAHIRTDEYDLFRSEDFRAWLAGQDLQPIGMRQLRNAYRAGHPA
jgi:chitin disaccharide deacetylase